MKYTGDMAKAWEEGRHEGVRAERAAAETAVRIICGGQPGAALFAVSNDYPVIAANINAALGTLRGKLDDLEFRLKGLEK